MGTIKKIKLIVTDFISIILGITNFIMGTENETTESAIDEKETIEEEEEEEEVDMYDKRIENSGCSKQHYSLQDCYHDAGDWRKCSKEMLDFKKCMEEQIMKKKKTFKCIVKSNCVNSESYFVV